MSFQTRDAKGVLLVFLFHIYVPDIISLPFKYPQKTVARVHHFKKKKVLSIVIYIQKKKNNGKFTQKKKNECSRKTTFIAINSCSHLCG